MKFKTMFLVIFGIMFLNFSAQSQCIINVYPGNIDAIATALASASSGCIVNVNPGRYSEITWVTVKNGITLKLQAGVTVDFLAGFTVEKDGTLETYGQQLPKVYINFGSGIPMSVSGKVNCRHTIFANYSWGSYWTGIWVTGEKIPNTNSLSTSGSSFDHCDIAGVRHTFSGFALYILNSIDVTVSNCNISNLKKDSISAIYIGDDSYAYIYKNLLQNNRAGVTCNYRSIAYFGSIGSGLTLDCNNGNNIITGNDYDGIHANDAIIYLMPPFNYNNISDNNKILNSYNYNAVAWNNSTISASRNYWGGGNPPYNTYADATSSIDISNALNCVPVPSLLSVGAIEEQNHEITGRLNKATNTSSDIDELLQTAIELLCSKNYDEALSIFKSIVLTYRDNERVYGHALSGISAICKITENKELLEYLKVCSKGEKALPVEKDVFANTLLVLGYHDEAILEYEAIAKSYPGTNHELQALVKISSIYFLYKKDFAEADWIYREKAERVAKKVGISNDINIKFLRELIYSNVYRSLPDGYRVFFLGQEFIMAKNYVAACDIFKLLVSTYETNGSDDETLYSNALSGIITLCGVANTDQHSGLDFEELFEYVKVRTKDDKNATPHRKCLYPELLKTLGYYHEAIFEYEEIYRSLTSSDVEIQIPRFNGECCRDLAPDILNRISLIYLLMDMREKAKEGSKSIDNDEEPTDIATDYSLSLNYPNPFNPTTTIQYTIPKDEYVKLVVYDVTGKVVKELVNGYKSAGRYNVEFNASGYASGIYYYRIEAGQYKNVQKMMLMK